MKQNDRELHWGRRFGVFAVSMILMFLAMAGTGWSATKTWIPTSGTNDWFEPANWSGSACPVDGDDVVIANADVTVMLTNSTADLGSFVISNTATLVFSNWNTTLSASNVFVGTEGVLTAELCDTNAVPSNSNRVAIACSNLTVQAGGEINVDGRGFKGAVAGVVATGQGPGGGFSHTGYGGGGGYGGAGGRGREGGLGGPTNGIASMPASPGSGGGTTTYYSDVGYSGGNGGGAIWIEAAGTVAIDGAVSANGAGSADGRRGGGGSGGAIYISCRVFSGTGTLNADGGAVWYPSISAARAGGGGGGRIAVVYSESAQASESKPQVVLSTKSGWSYYYSGDLGTIYMPSVTGFDSTWMPHSGTFMAGAITNWAVDSMLITNGLLKLEEDFDLYVTNSLQIVGSDGGLEVSAGGTVCCDGSLFITNGASLSMYSGPTNETSPEYGGLLSVAGIMSIGSNSWVYPYSDDLNGGSLLIEVGSLAIDAGGGINADGKGYKGGLNSDGYGPGKGKRGSSGRQASGGGYGGAGGDAPTVAGGATYCSSNAPYMPGSGGASAATDGSGMYGGGLVRIVSAGNVTLDGTISANAVEPINYIGYAGGSGGGIWLRCRGVFSGSASGSLSADGSGGSKAVYWECGGGGGGRIAVWIGIPAGDDEEIIAGDLGSNVQSAEYSSYLGDISVAASTNAYGVGQDGSVVFLAALPVKGTVIAIH